MTSQNGSPTRTATKQGSTDPQRQPASRSPSQSNPEEFGESVLLSRHLS